MPAVPAQGRRSPEQGPATLPETAAGHEHVGMPKLRNLLDRLRPAGIPGAAARAGVPADRVAELTAELAGVFGAFEPVEAECRAIRAAAERDARDVRQRAADQAEAMVADARANAGVQRAAAAAEAARHVSAGREALEADAERLAARIRVRADERMPALVERAMEILREGSA